ncbi:hypothetical protein HUT06_42225 [Actinomadura sp. NAK00032]|uniref:hypothetical protein n=1 Tax=Actinomadura sp. NAK00032 TaxID=2742128 RepID=UPI0015906809|nr:hypothetical protein [Actinomadura sp. NAK00032]QKW39835.1 hypothetical protein HUT06_42225 [Actinomadura sp. NAK00032]
MPELPVVAPPKNVVLPPANAPAAPQVAPGASRMTLMAPVGLEEGDEMDWAVVIGVALIAEIGLLWGAACIGLYRRRLALRQAAAADAAAG